MTRVRNSLVLALMAGAALSGCASPDAVFVETDGGIAIGAQPKEGKVQVGYNRSERYVAPAYTKTGAVPPVIAGFVAGGNVFAPEVNQTLATGSAAMLLSGDSKKSLKDLQGQICTTDEEKDKCLKAVAEQWQHVMDKTLCEANLGCKGERRLAVVGTQTDWGLRVESGVASQNWPELHFGFKRKEVTLVPVSKDEQKEGAGDHFPSALAMVSTGYNVPSTKPTPVTTGADGTAKPEDKKLPEVGFGVAQMIATGAAADTLAMDTDIRQAVKGQMQAAAKLSKARFGQAAEAETKKAEELNQAASAAKEDAAKAATEASKAQAEAEKAKTDAANSAAQASEAQAKAEEEKQRAIAEQTDTAAAAAEQNMVLKAIGGGSRSDDLDKNVQEVQDEVIACLALHGLNTAPANQKLDASVVDSVNAKLKALRISKSLRASATVGDLRTLLVDEDALRDYMLDRAIG